MAKRKCYSMKKKDNFFYFLYYKYVLYIKI